MSSPFTDQFWRALSRYSVLMPELGDDDETWLAEFNRVDRSAFSAVLITSSSSEGGGASGAQNFPQTVLMDALHCHRHTLDDTYELPPHLADFESAKLRRAASGSRRGMTLRFGQ